MKYYIVAGEASGDLHASNLIKKIKEKDSNAEICAWGGDLMEEAGAKVVKHIKELAFMGFTEVLLNLKTIKQNLSFCKKHILEYKPDALILIDYPGFNLRIAEFAHQHDIKVFYYISPQVWAWKKSRIKKIEKFVDHMFVILPFEKDFYKDNNFEVTYVGHPLIESVESFKISSDSKKIEGLSTDKKLIVLMPGSRKQEIKKVLPIMLSVKKSYLDFEWIIAGAPAIDKEFYSEIIKGEEIEILFNETYSLLNNAYAALVTSGTATLETALFNVPQVVCYKGGWLSYNIGKILVNKEVVRFIALVNLLLNKEVVKELIQSDLSVIKLNAELQKLINDKQYRAMIKEDYSKLQNLLGSEIASEKVASLIIHNI